MKTAGNQFNQSGRRTRRCLGEAFTLVEVVLAILIISGIMAVLLYFYQRAAETRDLVMKETEFISIGRLFFEKISTELRTARVAEEQFAGLEGSSNSITFICTSLPQPTRWIAPTNETVVTRPATDLVRVHYGIVGGTNLLDLRGIERTEEMLLASGSMNSSTNSTDGSLTNQFDSELNPNLVNLTNNLSLTNRLQRPDSLLTDQIKSLQFRYWNGRTWVPEWSSLSLPGGVEITISQDLPTEPTAGSEQESLPLEVYRRVIYLPNSSGSIVENSTNLTNETVGAEGFFQ